MRVKGNGETFKVNLKNASQVQTYCDASSSTHCADSTGILSHQAWAVALHFGVTAPKI